MNYKLYPNRLTVKDIHQYNRKYTHLHKTTCKRHKNKKLKIQVFWDIVLLLLGK